MATSGGLVRLAGTVAPMGVAGVRSYVVNGEAMVMVKGGGHWGPSGSAMTQTTQLGLASEGIEIKPKFHHMGIKTDDYGGPLAEIPAEVMYLLGEVDIYMKLIHYDVGILGCCLVDAQAGGTLGPFGPTGLISGFLITNEGKMAGAGSLLGNGVPTFSSGNHFISLNILSPVLGYPWRFPSSYLAERPVEIPLGNQTTIAHLHWRAIPYNPPIAELIPAPAGALSLNNLAQGMFNQMRGAPPAPPPDGTPFDEYISDGAILWDHRLDN